MRRRLRSGSSGDSTEKHLKGVWDKDGTETDTSTSVGPLLHVKDVLYSTTECITEYIRGLSLFDLKGTG